MAVTGKAAHWQASGAQEYLQLWKNTITEWRSQFFLSMLFQDALKPRENCFKIFSDPAQLRIAKEISLNNS
jgi:hypothetical protein